MVIKLSTLKQGLDKITDAFNEDFIKKFQTLLELSIQTIEDRYCVCGDHRNVHANGEGGSPSACEEEYCLCNDYHYSLIHSLFKNRDEYVKYNDVKKYPLLPLIVVLQLSGFDCEYLQLMDDTFVKEIYPKTTSKKHAKKG